ncbi:g7214 [Coccomyxa elongata]
MLTSIEHRFCALSVNTHLDRTDAAAILPNGHLVLSVRRSTYERLGLVGQHATHDPDVYRIDIDLFGKKFSSDSRFSKKVMQCLREHTGELDFLCVKTVDGRCAEVDFSMMPGVSFHMHRQPTYRSSTRVGLVVPDMSKLMIPASGTASEVGTGTEVGTTLEQIHEWLGGIACGISDMSWCDAADAQAKQALSADMTCIEWEGLLPACSITDAITLCRDEVGRGACPWAAVYVWGLVDAPVSWLGTEHGFGPVMGGENDYIVLVLPDDQYVLFVSAGEGDGFAHFNTTS